MKTKVITLLALAATFMFPSAWADETGAAGTVHSVQIQTLSSDLYAAYRGRLMVKQSIDDVVTEYRWGGTSCGSKNLTDSQMAYLMDLAAAPYMLIEPHYLIGQGQVLCLVAFKAFNSKYE